MMEKSYLEKIIDIVEYNLLSKHKVKEGEKIICAVSGGADSVCLLYVLCKLSMKHGYHIYAVHVNHGIRGEEAKRDENFVRNLCKEYGVELRVYFCDVPAISKERKQSVEETARELRYTFFDKAILEFQADKIAIAHHMDDNVETFLFHLLRGSKIKGLVGMPSNRKNIIRPFLEIRRKDLFELVSEQKLSYVEDSTNKDIAYTRNYIRNVMIPELCEKINVRAVEHISGAMEEFYSLYQSVFPLILDVERDILLSMQQGEFIIDREKASRYPCHLFAHALSVMMEKAGFIKRDITQKHYNAIYELCSLETGKKVMLPFNIEIRNEYNRMVFDINNKESEADNLFGIIPLGKAFGIDIGKYRIDVEYLTDLSKIKEVVSKENTESEVFDLDTLDRTVPLVVRQKQKDDYMIIDKKGRHKKLSRIFIDDKISRYERECLPVVAQGNKVLFIPGLRRSRDTWVSDKTKTVIIVSVKKVL